MAVNKIAWITVLVGGIIGLLLPLIFLLSLTVGGVSSSIDVFAWSFLVILFLLPLALIVIALTLMRNSRNQSLGSVLVLIISVVDFNLISLIGGIIGLVSAKR